MLKKETNFLGMDFVRVEAGSFTMGNLQPVADQDVFKQYAREDEQPVHSVTISKPFYVATTPVTNRQYEEFDRQHRQYRGKNGFSQHDDDAVVYVSWYDAMAFCQWLSDKDGRHYRLPTEAEWEYFARADTKTSYFTGDDLPEEYQRKDLAVQKTAPNPWGLYDIHGLVEEWCYDWYGPYPDGDQENPVGYDRGTFKVLRGGSHSTDNEYLRSSNRMAQLPEAKNWLMGFRVVIGELPENQSVLINRDQRYNGVANLAKLNGKTKKAKTSIKAPYFAAPQNFVKLEYDPPFGFHNHQPAITEMPNGDLMTIWYTTKSEVGRELRYAMSRFTEEEQSWDPASIFWIMPDRNIHGCDLFWDQDTNVVYHFTGVAVAESKGYTIAVAMRQSFDNGISWTAPRFISPEFEHRGQVISSTIKTSDNKIIVLCDDIQDRATEIYLSEDNGITWTDPALGKRGSDFSAGQKGPLIAGIHGAVVELDGGKLLAAGRGQNIDGQMPLSLSTDGGFTWTYSASGLPPVGSGQRLTMIRLQEGPILLVGFTDSRDLPREEMKGIQGYDANGNETTITGLYAALSYDEGKTWPIKRVISDGSGRRMDSTDPNQYDAASKNKNSNRIFTMDATSGEAMGYCAMIQATDGMIHLISSKQHYRFNYQWLVEPTKLQR